MLENSLKIKTLDKKNSRILVVDDEPTNLKIVGEILKKDGLKFIFAENGAEALEAAKEEKPSLILLDIMMPVMDGISVCKELQKSPETSDIPIIFITAKAEREDIVRGFAVGAVDYITKPFKPEELLARVHTHLDLYLSRKNIKLLHDEKTELLTTIAHDIKNPSGAIYSISNLILEDIENDKFDLDQTGSLLKLIYSSSKGMYDLVEEILNTERQRNSNLDIAISKPINAVEIIQYLIDLNQIKANEKSILLDFEYEIEPYLKITRRILTEMFDNLISNAVKYSNKGGTINIKLIKTHEDYIRFEVADSAAVISPNAATKLFKKFVRGSEETNPNISSHGVGLSIVKRLVNMFEGRFGVNARIDSKGNLFYIEIPQTVSSSYI